MTMTDTVARPGKTREILNAVLDSTRWNGFEFRDDDIVVGTWSKSGTTLTQQIIGQLISNGDAGVYGQESSAWLDFRFIPAEHVLAMANSQTHRRWLKTHLPADALVVTRLILCRVAREHGKLVSFAPQALPDGIGSGAHVHVSLTRNGVPIFSNGNEVRELTADGAAAIGGILSELPNALGVLAPSLLSTTRLQAGKWSGAYICWGVENREAAVRLCQATLGNPHGANVEIKVTDHTANPYAALAVILGLAHHGITTNAPLPAEAPVDPSALSGTPAAIATFDTDQGRNVAASCASPLVRSILSDRQLEAIAAVRGHEVTLAASTPYDDLVVQFRYAWSS